MGLFDFDMGDIFGSSDDGGGTSLETSVSTPQTVTVTPTTTVSVSPTVSVAMSPTVQAVDLTPIAQFAALFTTLQAKQNANAQAMLQNQFATTTAIVKTNEAGLQSFYDKKIKEDYMQYALIALALLMLFLRK